MKTITFRGARQILNYNLPFYRAAALGCLVATAVLIAVPLPGAVRLALLTALAGVLFWTVSSLAVSHYIYDRSPLYRFEWTRELLPSPPKRWLNIHAGLDYCSNALGRLFPDAEGSALDIYDPRTMTEPAIRRARRSGEASLTGIKAKWGELPVPDCSSDAAFVVFCAHELREAEVRSAFFNELARVLKVDGVAVVVEHLRDLPNLVAFGPGFMHFLPREAFLTAGFAAGLQLAQDRPITPFVHVLMFKRLP